MIIYIFSLLLLFIGILMLLIIFIKNKQYKKSVNLKKRKCQNYAIIIPARNEANVIEGLLKSITKQTDLTNTYVIVESEDDPTCKITEKYHGNIFVRKDLKN